MGKNKKEMPEGIRPEDGYFIRNLKTDRVVCPAGAVLTRKCTKSNGYARYMRKAACSRCVFLERCCRGKGKWKEIDFWGDATYVKSRNWTKK